MVEAAKKGTSKARVGEASAPTDANPEEHPTPTCTVGFCPICLAVTAMQPLRPDVIEHLLAAGRELLLATRAVLDARSEPFDADGGGRAGAGKGRLEKIDIR